MVLKGHTGNIYDASFSHNSKQIVSASADGSIRFWDVMTGVCQSIMRQTPDGEINHIEGKTEILPQSVRGDAWRYCYTKDANGNIRHPCQYENWGEIYTP